MASQTITWIPVNDSTSIDQTVQYRTAPAGTWTTFSVVAKNIATETISGLADNYVYEFRVLNNCSEGGSIPSVVARATILTCPTLTLSATSFTITVSFIPLGGSVDAYNIQLRNESGTTILQSYVVSAPFGSTVTHTFNTSISPTTNYNIRVIPSADEFVKSDCALGAITTESETEPSTCGSPTNLTIS